MLVLLSPPRQDGAPEPGFYSASVHICHMCFQLFLKLEYITEQSAVACLVIKEILSMNYRFMSLGKRHLRAFWSSVVGLTVSWS